jgi:hypothetical protein
MLLAKTTVRYISFQLSYPDQTCLIAKYYTVITFCPSSIVDLIEYPIVVHGAITNCVKGQVFEMSVDNEPSNFSVIFEVK